MKLQLDDPNKDPTLTQVALAGAGREGRGRRGPLASSFGVRGSCSSAFLFVPAARVFRSRGASRGGMLGLRTSDLAVEDETGADKDEEDGGKREGFPVSMDERTESRNCREVS